MKVVNTFIICFPFILFIPFLAEAKTADEWFNEGLKVDPKDV